VKRGNLYAEQAQIGPAIDSPS